MSCFDVRPLLSAIAMNLVEEYHYSHRRVGAKYSFGLWVGDDLAGCVTYSQPASYTLCKGVCGPNYKSDVLELSRLVVITGEQNAASYLIGNSLCKLGNSVVVSYADCNEHVGHVGYVYQATNWIYTGRSTAEPVWVDPRSGEVVSYTRRHVDKKAEAIGLDWTQLTRKSQVGKHRYVTFTGDRRYKKKAQSQLRYHREEYPKGDTMRHGHVARKNTLFG